MDNLRGSVLMILAMAGFAIEDLFIKLLSERMSVPQILVLTGLMGALAFSVLLRLSGRRFWTPALRDRNVMLRTAAEMIGGMLFVIALSMGDLSLVAVILQATPLFMVIGAAVFLHETVGWRRWSAVGIGFLGMLLVLRPGSTAFDSAAIWAVLSVVVLAVRDLVTRRVDPAVPSLQLSTAAYSVFVPGGLALYAIAPAPITALGAYDILLLVGMVAVGMLAYSAIVAATRIGEISLIAPFRYSRLVFALLLAVFVLGETPDRLTLLGAAILIGSGLYTLYREARLRAQHT